jgi:hypothetical protein
MLVALPLHFRLANLSSKLSMATAPSQLGGSNAVPKFLHIKERAINPCPLHLANCFAAHSLNNNNNTYSIAPLSRQYSLTQLHIFLFNTSPIFTAPSWNNAAPG